METTIKKKITQGISKFDSLMQNLPKEVKVDDIVSLNVTFVNQPVLGNSSIEVDINGLFIWNNNPAASRLSGRNYDDPVLCDRLSPMLGISLHEAVFSSASASYFEVIILIYFPVIHYLELTLLGQKRKKKSFIK